MIISKVSLKRSPGAQGALAKMLLNSAAGDRGHQLVWSLFARTGEEKRRTELGLEIPLFLFREIEPGAFLVVSRDAPCDPHDLWAIDQKDYIPAFSPDQKLGFVLRAFPAVAVRAPGVKRGVRTDAIMHAKKPRAMREKGAVFGPDDVTAAGLDWLYKREARLGVTFDRRRCSAGGYREVRIPNPKDGEGKRLGQRRDISFHEIDYEGVLTVTDADKLKTALFAGVGKAKAYGCGLLLVRPIPS
jgi:CRISPR system Cascade subunit CasE